MSGKKKTDKYNLKIPIELKTFFEKYIKKFDVLGYKSVSQFFIHVLQKEAGKIIEKYPDLMHEKKQLNLNEIIESIHTKFVEIYSLISLYDLTNEPFHTNEIIIIKNRLSEIPILLTNNNFKITEEFDKILESLLNDLDDLNQNEEQNFFSLKDINSFKKNLDLLNDNIKKILYIERGKQIINKKLTLKKE